MTELAKVDGMIGSTVFAINLLAIPSEKTRAILSDIQELVLRYLPQGSLFRCPVISLHMSLFQFVHSRKAKSNHEKQVWDVLSKTLISDLDSVTDKTKAFSVNTPSIRVSESAIILQFSESREIEFLRNRLTSIVSATELNWNRPDIQHVSMFRYLKPIQLNEVRTTIDSIKLPRIDWNISELQLVKEKLYPSLEFTKIQNYTLS